VADVGVVDLFVSDFARCRQASAAPAYQMIAWTAD
jgi:hypothetical protein